MHLKTKKAIGKFVVAALFSAFGGVAMNYSMTANTMGNASLSWPSVNGTVVKSVLRTQSPNSDMRSEQRSTRGIEYKYNVNGEEYTGTRIRYGSQSDWSVGSNSAEEGKSIKLYFNPEEPTIAIVEPGYQGEGMDVAKWVGIAFLAVAVLSCAHGIVLLIMTPKRSVAEQ